MINTVKMSATALREIMGEAFDYDLYERGRRDERELFKKAPDCREAKLEEVKDRLETGRFKHSPGPSYWVGCLCEFDFYR